MAHLIDKSVLVAELKRWIELLTNEKSQEGVSQIDKLSLGGRIAELQEVKVFLDTLEVKEPYEQCVQYDSVKAGIQEHAETYSFNIESELFNQLTKEQQALWRKEIEQAVISGGEAGVELARDPRYKENVEVKEVDLDKALSDLDKDIKEFVTTEEFENDSRIAGHYWAIAKHAFLLGLKSQKGV